MNPYTDLCASLTGRLTCPTGQAQVSVTLFWCNRRPSEITIAIRNKSTDHTETWAVARNTLLAGLIDGLQGAWVGMGQFSVCHRPPSTILAFHPHHADRAFVFIDHDPIKDFVLHTLELVPAGEPEHEINAHSVEQALTRILG